MKTAKNFVVCLPIAVKKKKKTDPGGPLPPDYPVLKHGGGASDWCCCRLGLSARLVGVFGGFLALFPVVLGEIPTEPLAFLLGNLSLL